MGIRNLPCWVGSESVNETGERWMSSARPKLRLPQSGWLSEMAGRSKEFLIIISQSNNDFNPSYHLHPLMLQAAGGAWPSGDIVWRIRVNSGVKIVSDGNNATLWFGGAINGRVILENHGWILGRGGNGGNSTGNGFAAPHGAIYRESKITLEIQNYGIIAGGGGGGAAGRNTGNGGSGGGGGAPLGRGGSGRNNYTRGCDASIDTPGPGGPRDNNQAGESGGYWGHYGTNSTHTYGGAPGYAIGGGGPIIWSNYGDVRGAVT